MVTKKIQNNNKEGTKRIPVTLTLRQVAKINDSIGILGSNQSDVLRYIVTNWLVENENKSKEKK